MEKNIPHAQSAEDDGQNFTAGLYVSAEDDGEINTAGLYLLKTTEK